MLSFEEIWPRFKWVIQDMREGMGFFEGFVPSVDPGRLLQSLAEVATSGPESFASSVWSDEGEEEDRAKCQAPSDFIQCFLLDRILLLHFNYSTQTRHSSLELRLILEKYRGKTSLEILCYRGPVLVSKSPKESVAGAIAEFRRLREIFRGDACSSGRTR